MCPRGTKAEDKRYSLRATDNDKKSLERCLESVKHYLWHGNSAKALDRLQDLEDALEEGWGCDEAGEKKPRPDNDSAARMLKVCTGTGDIHHQ